MLAADPRHFLVISMKGRLVAMRTIRKPLLVLICGLGLLCGGCLVSPSRPPEETKGPIEEPIKQSVAEGAVRRYNELTLREPDSAQYMWTPIERTATGWVMRYLIKSKNAYGGMTNWQAEEIRSHYGRSSIGPRRYDR